MSLGFNNLRPPKVHSLPGATHSQFVPVPAKRKTSTSPPSSSKQPQESTVINSASAPMLSRRMQYLEDAFKKSTSLAEQFRNTKDETDRSLQNMYEKMNSVYGKAAVSIEDEEGNVIADAGEDLFLVYPMRNEEETGKIFMSAKVVDSVTARIELKDVCVYDPSTDGVKRRVHSFSAFPK